MPTRFPFAVIFSFPLPLSAYSSLRSKPSSEPARSTFTFRYSPKPSSASSPSRQVRVAFASGFSIVPSKRTFAAS